MQITTHSLASTVGREASQELDSALRMIRHCVGQLNTDQLWWRPAEEMNSIANLLLHLAGNLRQWIVAGIGGAADTRERWKEFEQRDVIPTGELMTQLAFAVDDSKDALADVSPEELMRRRMIQNFDVSGLQAIFHSVAHFRGHTQEIVHLTRVQLRHEYQFDFVPTPEQSGHN